MPASRTLARNGLVLAALVGSLVGSFAAALAHGRSEAPEAAVQALAPAGTLACTALADAGLVFGNAPVATCRFVSVRGDLVQAYGAILARSDAVRGAPRVRSWTWSVSTPGGTVRPGLLDGAFAADDLGLRGRDASVRLRLDAAAPERRARFALAHPGVDLAALGPAEAPSGGLALGR